MSDPWIDWYYAKQALPGYAELTAAHEAMNLAAADAEVNPDRLDALALVEAALCRWIAAYRTWHPHAAALMPPSEAT